jgi:hypothetical protein
MWICPSRERPHNIKRLFDAWKELGSTPGILWVDLDDKHFREYWDIELPRGWSRIAHERVSLGAIFNRVFEICPDEPWYGLLGDDVLPRTKDFDLQLIKAAGSDGMAYANDLLKGEKHAAHPVIGGDLIRRLGWIAPPGMEKLYIDNVLMDVASVMNKAHYLPDVIMEHLHFSNGKAPNDATYRKPSAESDKAAYEAWRVYFNDQWL